MGTASCARALACPRGASKGSSTVPEEGFIVDVDVTGGSVCRKPFPAFAGLGGAVSPARPRPRGSTLVLGSARTRRQVPRALVSQAAVANTGHKFGFNVNVDLTSWSVCRKPFPAFAGLGGAVSPARPSQEKWCHSLRARCARLCRAHFSHRAAAAAEAAAPGQRAASPVPWVTGRSAHRKPFPAFAGLGGAVSPAFPGPATARDLKHVGARSARSWSHSRVAAQRRQPDRSRQHPSRRCLVHRSAHRKPLPASLD